MTETPAALPPPAPTPPALPPHRRRRVWPWVVLVMLGVGVYFLYTHSAQSAAAAQSQAAGHGGAGGRGGGGGAVPVLAAKARQADLKVYLSGLIGTVTALYTVTVHTRVDGQLMTVDYHEGQFVNADQELAQIDPRPFQVQLEMAQAQMAKDRATLANANVDLDRYKVLYAQDSVPKQTLDTQVSLVAEDDATLKSDQANIDTAQLSLVYSKVTAPISGRIGLRLVDPGNIVHAADANGIAVITQIQPITVVFPIVEDQLPKVLPKIRAGEKLEVDAYDRDNQKLLATGSVLTLDNQVNITTGTVNVKAVFPNTNEALFPNQFVQPHLLVDTLQKAIIVPSAAVQRGPTGTYVFVIKADNTVDMRTVNVQLTQGDDTVLSKGVSSGETVVTDGLDKLQAGAKVQIRPAAPTGAPTTGSSAGGTMAGGSAGSSSSGPASGSAPSSGAAGSSGSERP